MASLTDVLTSMQQGVVALNNFAVQAKGSFNNIAAKLSLVSAPGVAWTTYTPSVSAISGTLTSYVVNSAGYQQIGKIVHIAVDVSITNAGTGSGQLLVSTPVTSAHVCILTMLEFAVTDNAGWGYIGPGSNTLQSAFYNNVNPIVTGYRIAITGVYEAA